MDKLAGNTLRTRLVMAGVFLGALLALSLSVAFSWGGGESAAGGGGRVEESPEAKAAFHSPPGSCLFWAQPDAADIRVLPCDQPHLYEVTGVVNIADKYPPGAPSPNVDEWRDIAMERCTDGADTYLGKALDPYGRFTVSALRPSTSEWGSGNREMRCVLQWAAPGGALQPVKGKVADQSQAAVWDTGTCLALAGKTVGNPIDCNLPHAYEIVAQLDLKTQFQDRYPSQDKQKAWLDTECNKDMQAYAGGIDLSEKKLILTWDLREQESWDAGSTLVNCKVGSLLPDNSGLQAITGSIQPGGPDAGPPPGGQDAGPPPGGDPQQPQQQPPPAQGGGDGG